MPAPVPVMLGAAGWSFELGADGALAHVALDGSEVLRGLQLVVRDDAWGTLPGQASVELGRDGDELVVRVRSVHRFAAASFAWEGELRVGPDGLDYRFEGAADGPVETNRIGFVVLHPAALAGAPAAIAHPDGSTEATAFPDAVAPHQPFLRVAGIRHPLPDGRELELAFQGEVFETEDQRNWSDASFKTYSRPLALGYPYRLEAGERVGQRVSVRAHGASTTAVTRPTAAVARPALGVMVGPDDGGVDLVTAVRELGLDHVRVDVAADATGLRGADALRRAAAVPVELAVHLGVGADAALAELGALLDERTAPLAAVLAFDADAPATTADALARLRTGLGAALAGVPLFTGTDDNLAELDRDPPPTEGVDGVTFALNPQVHDGRDGAVIETAEVLAAMAATAQRLHPVVGVGALSLRPRRNIYRQGVVVDRLGRDAASADPRQAEAFAAAWLAASLAGLAGGVARITALEFTGPRGLTGAPVAAVVAALGASRTVAPRLDLDAGLALLGLDAGTLVANLRPVARIVELDGRPVPLGPYQTTLVPEARA